MNCDKVLLVKNFSSIKISSMCSYNLKFNVESQVFHDLFYMIIYVCR